VALPNLATCKDTWLFATALCSVQLFAEKVEKQNIALKRVDAIALLCVPMQACQW